MVLVPVLCPHCQSDRVIKGGLTKVANLPVTVQSEGERPSSRAEKTPAVNAVAK